MNIDEMTLDQIRDYIAECKGWRYKYGKHQCLWVLGDFPNGAGSKSSPVHPVPDTMDAAAEALPYNWRWEVVVFSGDTCHATVERGTFGTTAAVRGVGYVGDGNTRRDQMKRAMFNAAAKAWQREKVQEAIRNAKDGECVPVSKPYLIPYFWHIKVASDGTGIVGNTASVATVSQTWTLPTDTPDGEVYIQPGDWNIWNEFTGQDNTSGIKWRPTDVPKAEAVKADPEVRFGKRDAVALNSYLRCHRANGHSSAELSNLIEKVTRFIDSPEAP